MSTGCKLDATFSTWLIKQQTTTRATKYVHIQDLYMYIHKTEENFHFILSFTSLNPEIKFSRRKFTFCLITSLNPESKFWLFSDTHENDWNIIANNCMTSKKKWIDNNCTLGPALHHK